MIKKLKYAVTIVVIFVGVPALAIMVLWHGRCHESVVSSADSPDKRFAAVVSFKDCGPSQPVATLLRFVEKDQKGEVAAYSENMLLIEGKSDVASSWSDGSTLSIGVPKGAKVVYRRHEWATLKTQFVER